MIAEYDNGAAASSPSREYVYAGGGLLAKIEGGWSTLDAPETVRGGLPFAILFFAKGGSFFSLHFASSSFHPNRFPQLIRMS